VSHIPDIDDLIANALSGDLMCDNCWKLGKREYKPPNVCFVRQPSQCLKKRRKHIVARLNGAIEMEM
jgi:hypothetical protein